LEQFFLFQFLKVEFDIRQQLEQSKHTSS